MALDEANGDEAIQTFIVGRKFSDIQDLEVGAKICLLRHPENIKDPNAIKVKPFLSFLCVCSGLSLCIA